MWARKQSESTPKPGRFGLLARSLFDRKGGRDGRGLTRAQRCRLLASFRVDLADQVDDAEHRGISVAGASRLSLTRALIRWLERDESPGPGAVPLLEDFLRTIARGPNDIELAERDAVVAAIHDLGGDDRAASDLWREPAEEHPEALAAYGRTLHRLMGEAGLTVSQLAGLAEVDRSAIVAFLCGVEEARTSETVRLAGALRLPVDLLFEGMESELRRTSVGWPAGGLNPGSHESAAHLAGAALSSPGVRRS